MFSFVYTFYSIMQIDILACVRAVHIKVLFVQGWTHCINGMCGSHGLIVGKVG